MVGRTCQRSFLADAELNGTFPIEVHLDVNDSAAHVFGRELRKTTVSRDSLPVGIIGTSIAPNTGTFEWNEPLGLVWEAYDLATTDGNAGYRTRITLERTFKSNLKGFVARIAANVRNVIEQDGSGTGKVSVTYDQLRPTGTVVTDFLTISLSGAVPGPYRVEIEVLDLLSGKSVKRASDFVLAPN